MRGCSRSRRASSACRRPSSRLAAGPLAQRIERAGRAGAAAARLSRRLAARRRVRHARPLRRPALDGADVRAARRRGDGALGRAAARAGRDPRRLRGRARADLRVPAPAHAALGPRRRQRRRGRVGARLGRDGGRRARAPARAHRRARRRLRRRGGGAQRARARPDRPRVVGRRAAPRRAARHPRGAAPARHPRAARDLRAHAPLRARGRATIRRNGAGEAGSRIVNTGSWIYQPHFLSGTPNASPYWPGTAVARRGRRGRRGSSGCWANADTGSCDPRREAGRVAGHAGAQLERRARPPCGGGARRARSSPAR